MGLDIRFEKAKRHRVEETEERLNEIKKEFENPNYSVKKFHSLKNEYDELNPWKEVAYFRKVNFLLPFFEYGENCSRLEIDGYKIDELLVKCKQVLEDHSLAETLLPTQGGFFFGNSEYNDWYFEDVKEVYDKFSEIAEDFNSDEDMLSMVCSW